MSREDYADRFGASQADLDRVAEFAKSYGIAVVDTDRARRSVFLSGTVGQFAKAFGTAIEHYEYDCATYRGRVGELSVPSDIADLVEGVFGIDDRPAARPQFKYHNPPAAKSTAGSLLEPHAAAAAATSFTPPQLAKLYDFPTDADGSNETIGIIELGGGYRPTDLAAYFKGLGIANPSVTTVRVDGANNAPSNADSADGEVMLDIEVAAAVAPKAKIVVYFAPNTTKGFLDAITMAVHDTTHKPSVISISWGGAENTWTAQALDSYDQAFKGAAALGVTICCAAGDAGSGDQNPDERQARRPRACGLPGVEPERARLRRHEDRGDRQQDHVGGGLERGRAEQRGRRRHQRSLSGAELSGIGRRSRRRRTRAIASVAACPTSPAMPTRKAATRCASTDRTS